MLYFDFIRIQESKIEKSDVKVETDQLKDEKVLGKVFDQFLYSDHRANNRQALDSHNGNGKDSQ